MTIRKIIPSAVAILLAIPLFLRADNPAPSLEKLVYGKPDGVPDKTRADINSHRGNKIAGIPDDFNLFILCPNHEGLTVQEHPSVFWFMNKPITGHQCRLTITTEGEPEPLLEKDVDPAKAVGIQRIDLKDLAKPLQANTDYKISVTILVPEDRSADYHTSGLIKRIAAPEKLISKLLTRPTPGERAVVYARERIWYDALSAISDQITAEPEKKSLHLERADFLKQGDLPEVAAYDEKLGSK